MGFFMERVPALAKALRNNVFDHRENGPIPYLHDNPCMTCWSTMLFPDHQA